MATLNELFGIEQLYINVECTYYMSKFYFYLPSLTLFFGTVSNCAIFLNKYYIHKTVLTKTIIYFGKSPTHVVNKLKKYGRSSPILNINNSVFYWFGQKNICIIENIYIILKCKIALNIFFQKIMLSFFHVFTTN